MTNHGGDVWRVAEEFGIPATDLIDFSANINPRGLPEAARRRLVRDAANPHLLSLYPDPAASTLRRALAEKFAVSADSIVVGPGAEALLSPILRTIAPRRALIPIPAFSEYRRVCEVEEITAEPFPLRRADLFRLPAAQFCEAIEPTDVVFLNFPHNPTGTCLDRPEAEMIHRATIAKNATLLLDEAFVDYVPESSLIREASAQSRIIVLRSLTKFYGCPALRVGYAVADPETIRRVRSRLPTWPITQLALDAMLDATGDRDYEKESLQENRIERDRLANDLSSVGFFVFPSAANYLLLELAEDMPRASELRQWLITNRRILIRNCDSYEGLAHGRYVRVAVRNREENCGLAEALAAAIRNIG